MPFKKKYHTEEERKAARKASRVIYENANRNKLREASRKWYEKNKERVREKKNETAKIYYQNNREKCIRIQQERRKKQKEERELSREQQTEELPSSPVQKQRIGRPRAPDSNPPYHPPKVKEPSFKCSQGSFLVSFN